MDTLRHIYGGEAALRQMWAPCRGGDGARGLWKMLQGGRVFLELGLIFPKLGVENSPNCSLPVGSWAGLAATLASVSQALWGPKASALQGQGTQLCTFLLPSAFLFLPAPQLLHPLVGSLEVLGFLLENRTCWWCSSCQLPRVARMGVNSRAPRTGTDPSQTKDTSMALGCGAAGNPSRTRDLLPPSTDAAHMGSYPHQVSAEAADTEALGAETRWVFLTGRQEKQGVEVLTRLEAQKAPLTPLSPQVSV